MAKHPAKKFAKVIRKSLDRQAEEAIATGNKIAVALSGGVDSCSLLASLLKAGGKPGVVSYTPHTHESTDFKMARDVAANFGLDFHPAIVPMEFGPLYNTAAYVISLGYRRKVGVECLTPLVYVLKETAVNHYDTLFTGDQADGYFIYNRRAAVAHDKKVGTPEEEQINLWRDDSSKRIDAIRKAYYDEDKSYSKGVQRIGQDADVEVVVPYRDKAIYKASKGTLWKDINKPRRKEPIRQAYPEYLDVTIPTRPEPVNLHKGDSEFAVNMGKILMADSRFATCRSPLGVYSQIYRELNA